MQKKRYTQWPSGWQEYFPDTGLKFVISVEEYLQTFCSLTNLEFPLCKNKLLARKKFSCVIFKRKWVIAFKYSKNTLTVHQFIWGWQAEITLILIPVIHPLQPLIINGY
ncbi:MAG: hypothetical protein JWO06_1976 [Bacteroidota bacterium]|nr:hypothetical protein [Bacteroidota bacterium]